MKDLYTENQKTLIKEIKEDTNKHKTILCAWMKRTNIVKKSKLHKICRFSEIPAKIPVASFMEIEQIIVSSVWNHERSQRAKAILRSTKLEASCFQISKYITKV